MQPSVHRRHRQQTIRKMVENRALYLMILPAFLYILIFHYWPMYGVQIAFCNFNFADGITGSKWVGLKWFNYFFHSNNFSTLVRNTLVLSLYDLLAGFPVPIMLALIMNAVPSQRFRKVSQTITYLPTMSIMLILRFGSIMSLGFDKVYSMQNALNYSVSEVLSTHIYKMGIQSTKYSYSAAVSLFNNVINFIMLVTVNRISGRLSGNSLW